MVFTITFIEHGYLKELVRTRKFVVDLSNKCIGFVYEAVVISDCSIALVDYIGNHIVCIIDSILNRREHTINLRRNLIVDLSDKAINSAVYACFPVGNTSIEVVVEPSFEVVERYGLSRVIASRYVGDRINLRYVYRNVNGRETAEVNAIKSDICRTNVQGEVKVANVNLIVGQFVKRTKHREIREIDVLKSCKREWLNGVRRDFSS